VLRETDTMVTDHPTYPLVAQQLNAVLSADLSFADMEDVRTEGTIFCRTTMPDSSINNAGCP
jgi:hypothetical protein